MTYRYLLEDRRELALRADCWAMLFEAGRGRACQVTDPARDAAGTVEVRVEGVPRRVPLVDLVAPPRPLPFTLESKGQTAAMVEVWAAER